jgi:thiamine-phosphate pyrophosphorylase
MTDPRFGDDLLAAIQRLPAGSGVIFRHYALAPDERRRLFNAVRSICRRRGHSLFLAGQERDALRWGADGFHNRHGATKSSLPRSAPVHDLAEMREAKRNRVQLVFVSPLFATTSHHGQRGMGRIAFGSLARQAGGMGVIALGGIDRNRARMLNRHIVTGWAAIDAFRKPSRQKRILVPT